MDSLKIESDIEKSTSNIKEKYVTLKRHMAENEEYLYRTFQPITKHLKLITERPHDDLSEDFRFVQETSTPLKSTSFSFLEASKSTLQQPKSVFFTPSKTSIIPIASSSFFDLTTPPQRSPSLASEYVNKVISDEMDGYDTIYGVRFDGKNLLMGNAEIKICNDIITVGGNKTFLGTPGLYKLLFLKEPGTESIEKSDWKTYQQILSITKAHKKGFSSTGKVNRLLNNKKYTRVISKLFPPRK